MKYVSVCSLLFLFRLCGPLSAQSAAGLGAITGIVVDGTGAGIPGAAVEVIHTGLGIHRQMLTTAAGSFGAASLPPAAGYSVTIKKDGFASYRSSDLEVQVGREVFLHPVLPLASVRVTVEVRAAEPLNATDSGIASAVGPNQIQNLPINGRRVDGFVLLTPAVAPEGTSGLLSFRGVPGGNAFLTDGNDTTDQLWNENGGRARIASNISQDAVQEFQVLSNNYSAEFGRASGGVINTVTRSGSNDLHGTGFWFFRNQDFNARDRYSATNPAERRNQGGASVGGAIVKQKLFYFANFELLRRYFPMVSSMTTAPLFNSAGAFVGTCGASADQCSAAIHFFDRFKTVIDRKASNNLGFGRLDYRPNERGQFAASFNLLNWSSPNGLQTAASSTTGAAIGANGNSAVKTRFARLSWTAIVNPQVVNEFRFGWFKDRLVDTLSAELVPSTGVPAISVQGVSNLGTSTSLPRVYPTEDRFQFADTLSFTLGKHTIKTGVDISHVRDVQDQVYQGNGAYTYSTFTAFALDFSGNTTGAKNWQAYTQAFGPSLVDTWIRDYIGFVQDEYHLTRRLTVNAGLRYEFSQYYQPPIGNADYRQTYRIPEPKTDFAPRLGLAWSAPDGKTVVRGGYGIFYARTPAALVNWLTRDNSNFQYTISLQGTTAADLAAGPVFPLRLSATDRKPLAGSTSMTFAADNWRTPYTQQADIGVERQVAPGMTVSASYIWSRGAAFTTTRDANVGPVGPNVTYTILDTAGNVTGTYTTPTYLTANRVDPRYQRIGVLGSNGNTYYNGLALQATKRAGRWWEGSASYTWSHALDQNLGLTGDNLSFGSTPRTVFNDDLRDEKGTSPLDQRQRFVVNSAFNLNFGLKRGTIERLVDRWQFSQITTLASGPSDTPVITVSGTPFTGAAFNSTLDGLGGSTRVPFQPRGCLPIGMIHQVDARLSKVFALGERSHLALNFEAFNVTNSQFNTSVLTTAYSASKLVLTPVARTGQGSASAGFPDGTNARRAQAGLRLVF